MTESAETIAEPDKEALEALMGGLVGSLNGYDEKAIEQFFGSPFDEIRNGRARARSILFVLARRDGMKDQDAYGNVMLMTLSQLDERYTEILKAGGGEGKA